VLGGAFSRANAFLGQRMKSIPLPMWLPTKANRDAASDARVIWREIDAMIDARRGEPEAGQLDLMSMLLGAHDAETGQPLSQAQVRREVALITSAGHGTSAWSLTWTFWLLATHPAVLAQLREELDRVLGSRLPAMQDWPALSLTRQTLEEGLRLYPPAWSISRRSVEADRIDGFDIPAGATVIMPAYVIHRDPALWPDPERFDPTRFAPERSEARDPFSYLSFSGGPRKCIGQQMAFAIQSTILAATLQDYDIEPVRPVNVAEPHFVLTIEGGLPVRVHRRAANARLL
jgi:cytochrome P450